MSKYHFYSIQLVYHTHLHTVQSSAALYNPPHCMPPPYTTLPLCIRWKKGDWTDDTDLMLLILQMACDLNGKVDAKDFARRLLHWARHGIEELGDIGEERQQELPT